MKYLFLGLLPLSQAFRLHQFSFNMPPNGLLCASAMRKGLTRQSLHLIKNTPYGPLEGAP